MNKYIFNISLNNKYNNTIFAKSLKTILHQPVSLDGRYLYVLGIKTRKVRFAASHLLVGLTLHHVKRHHKCRSSLLTSSIHISREDNLEINLVLKYYYVIQAHTYG